MHVIFRPAADPKPAKPKISFPPTAADFHTIQDGLPSDPKPAFRLTRRYSIHELALADEASEPTPNMGLPPIVKGVWFL